MFLNKKLFAYVIFLIFLLGLWVTNGKIPASSMGDDVFFSEIAHSLLTNSKHAYRSIPEDNLLIHLRFFSPPIVNILQFFSFSAFGLTQFSMAFVKTLCLFIFILASLFYAIKKLYKVPTAIFFSISFFSIYPLTAYALKGRYENIYVLFLIVSFILCEVLIKNKKQEYVSFFLSGIFIGLSIVTYYPLFPLFFFFSLLLVFFLSKNNPTILNLKLILSGQMVIGFAFLIWIFPDYELFIKQNLIVAKGKYFSFDDLINNVFSYSLFSFCFILFSSFFLWRYSFPNKDNSSKICFLMSILFSLNVFLSWFVNYAAFVFFLYGILNLRQYFLEKVFLVLSTFSTIIMIILIIKSFEKNRDYKIFSNQLNNNINMSKIIITDKPSWLYLRSLVKPDKLFEIYLKIDGMYSYRSKILFDMSYVDKISSVIIDERHYNYYYTTYPVFKFLIDSKKCSSKQIGDRLPYKVTVYNC